MDPEELKRTLAEVEALKKANEEALKQAELLRKGRDEALEQAELERKGREEERKGREEALKQAELERKGREEALKQAELERKGREEALKLVYVSAKEVMNAPLVGSQAKSKTVKTDGSGYPSPAVVRRWDSFQYEETCIPMESATILRTEVFTYRKGELSTDLETVVGTLLVTMMTECRRVLHSVKKDDRFDVDNFMLKGTPDDTKGGICDACAVRPAGIRGRSEEEVLWIGEFKQPNVTFLHEDDNTVYHPSEVWEMSDGVTENFPKNRITQGRNLISTLHQTYSYCILKRNKAGLGCKYFYFSNSTQFVFGKREWVQVEGGPNGTKEEVVFLSEMFTGDEARRAMIHFFDTVTKDAEIAVRADTRRIAEAEIAKKADDKRKRDKKNDRKNGPGGGSSSGSADVDSSASGHGQPGSTENLTLEESPLIFQVGKNVHGFEITTTYDALGIAALALLSDFTVLDSSTKATVMRGFINGMDLVWRETDIRGTPANTEFKLDILSKMWETELRAYNRLRAVQGKLIPQLVYCGHDIAMLWVMVTSYEGISMLQIAMNNGGKLDREMKEAAKRALADLHGLGVVHGDAFLRNCLWREADRSAVWIDFELASFKDDFSTDEAFAMLASRELDRFTYELDHPSELEYMLEISEDEVDEDDGEDVAEAKIAMPQVENRVEAAVGKGLDHPSELENMLKMSENEVDEDEEEQAAEDVPEAKIAMPQAENRVEPAVGKGSAQRDSNKLKSSHMHKKPRRGCWKVFPCCSSPSSTESG